MVFRSGFTLYVASGFDEPKPYLRVFSGIMLQDF
jgi:hypothetical protein